MPTKGIAVFMCNATDDPARERQHLDQLMGKRVDGLVVSARRADKRLPIGPFAHGLPVVYVFSQADDPDALCLLAGRRGRRRAGGRASGEPRPHAHRPCHRPRAFRSRAAAQERLSRGAGGRRACRSRRLLPLRKLVGSLGPRSRRAALRRPRCPARRAVLRQRPDRPRHGRRAARTGHRRARRTWRSSASTIGT